MNSALIKWLYLPDFFSTPNATNLISESPAPHTRATASHAETLQMPMGWSAGWAPTLISSQQGAHCLGLTRQSSPAIPCGVCVP